MKRFAMLSIGVVVATCIINACSSVPEVNLYGCDPDAILPSARCLKQTSATEDAGTDAESDAPSDPGLDPSILPPPSDPKACPGECQPKPSAASGGEWSSIPILVWFGPASQMPADCDKAAPSEVWRRYAGLVAPPAECDACACLPEGTCTGLPASIELRNGTCSTGESLPFDGPANWDGSCTSTNAIAAGTLCNGVLCAQSVATSALPGPANESCTPTVAKPNANLPKHEWLEGALACDRKDLEGECKEPDADHCRPTLPSPWLHCVAAKGKHDVCPDNYQDEKGPRWYYDDTPIDDRGCSECSCGAPKDSICVASLRLYTDSACNNELNNNTIASTDPFCVPLVPPGPAIGSKKINNLSYVPGTCAVNGGEPIGMVNIPSDEENSGVVTFCCRAPGPPSPPPLPPIR